MAWVHEARFLGTRANQRTRASRDRGPPGAALGARLHCLGSKAVLTREVEKVEGGNILEHSGTPSSERPDLRLASRLTAASPTPPRMPQKPALLDGARREI